MGKRLIRKWLKSYVKYAIIRIMENFRAEILVILFMLGRRGEE